MASATPNPIKRTAELRAYPGWLVREYADGMVDVAQLGGLALSPGFTSWAEAIDWLRAECGANVVDVMTPDHVAAAIHRARAERAYADAERFRKLKLGSAEQAARAAARDEDSIAEMLERDESRGKAATS